MNILNHFATGAAIALVVDKPILVIPLAIASHFVLDSVPHFGYPGEEGYAETFRHKLSYFSLIFDAFGMVILLAILGTTHLFALVAGALAVSPDIMWVYRYYFYERKGRRSPDWRIARFHVGIQWCEREWGIIIEILYSIGALLVVRSLV